MQMPIVGAAPLVRAHADVFRDLFENRNQMRHFENYLTVDGVAQIRAWRT